MNEQSLNTLISGIDDSISQEAKNRLEVSVRKVQSELEAAKINRNTKTILGIKSRLRRIKRLGLLIQIQSSIQISQR